MCGIIAAINIDGLPVDADKLQKMRDSMIHRGPDDAGFYIDGAVGLAHRRLSIIDLSDAGHQPMLSQDGSIVLTFNGEIYNYLELKENLIQAGHRFRSDSDSEVIVQQYEVDGERCVEKFNGMFAFAVWDRRGRKLFAARDRMGIKPLYYYWDGRKFILASEIKAILADAEVNREPNYQAIADYFYVGYTLNRKTFFKNIYELPPAHTLSLDVQRGQISISEYWDIHYDYNVTRTDEQLHIELLALLDDSVKIHCRSDAALGSHLSGGQDSSIIVALAARHRDLLQTFTVKFSEEAEFNETRYAKAVAASVGAKYNEGHPGETDLAALAPFLLWHMDVPIIPDGFSYYSVSKLARANVKVCLTGHGGDELFAGYPAQFMASYGSTEMFRVHADPSNIKKVPLLNRVKGMLSNLHANLKSDQVRFEEMWTKLHCNQLPDKNKCFSQGFIQALEGYSPRDDYLSPFRKVRGAALLDQCLYHDLRVYLPSLLHVEDRASMSLSIESRVPLLDYRLVELMATVPPEQKVKGSQPKYLMKQIAQKMLPDEVWQRKDKRPFPVPHRFWSNDCMKLSMEKLLFANAGGNGGLFDLPQLEKLYRTSHFQARTYAAVEMWFRLFIEMDEHWLDLAGQGSKR